MSQRQQKEREGGWGVKLPNTRTCNHQPSWRTLQNGVHHPSLLKLRRWQRTTHTFDSGEPDLRAQVSRDAAQPNLCPAFALRVFLGAGRSCRVGDGRQVLTPIGARVYCRHLHTCGIPREANDISLCTRTRSPNKTSTRVTTLRAPLSNFGFDPPKNATNVFSSTSSPTP
jgi:hypothetical protein